MWAAVDEKDSQKGPAEQSRDSFAFVYPGRTLSFASVSEMQKGLFQNTDVPNRRVSPRAAAQVEQKIEYCAFFGFLQDIRFHLPGTLRISIRS